MSVELHDEVMMPVTSFSMIGFLVKNPGEKKPVGNGQLGFDQKHRLLTQNPAGLCDASFVRASASTKVGEPLLGGIEAASRDTLKKDPDQISL